MRPTKTVPSFVASGLAKGDIPTTPVATARPADRWWLPLAQPFAEAGAHRLAHGRTPTFGFDYSQSYAGPTGYGGAYPTGMANLSSYMPLIILGIGALVLMRR